ncbi:MAG: tetratricopeptide repeat protein [Janthinobacterium lividum]
MSEAMGLALEERFEAAVVLHEAGRLDAAEAAYRAVLRDAAGHANALHMLGLLADQRGDGEAAVSLIGRAIAASPGRAYAHANLGNALLRLGRAGEAVASHRRAVSLRPDSAAMLGNLVAALLAAGESEAAVAAARRLAAMAPGSADAWLRLGEALSAGGDAAAAGEALRRCVALDPDRAEAWYNLGCLALAAGDSLGAAGLFREALARRPVFAPARTNLGVALHRLGRLAEAAEAHRAAIRDDPGLAGPHHNLGCVSLERNRVDEAADAFRAVLALRPGDGPARFGLCASRLPMLYRDEAEIGRRRAEYAAELSGLAAACDGARGARADALAAGVGSCPPFFLAYQGRDDRALQAEYGALCCRLAEAAYGTAPAPRPSGDGRIRVAVVSGFFCRHTVWSLLLRGWLEHLDRARFVVGAFHTGAGSDAITARASAMADSFVSGPRTLAAWRAAILAGEPDVVLYPEIGMDPVAAHLAAQRLAPVQAMSWGHPVTSGMPSIDLFLSSALMEPTDGDAHYTERLVRLPNLGTCYEPETAEGTPASRASLGLREGAVAFWSGQALYKYRPAHDALFARIAQGVGDCQFVFIEFAREPEVTALFRARLERAFAAQGLEAARHCVFLPSLDAGAFVAGIGACDVVLDTPGWSGGKSTLDGLAQARPIVTLPGPLMRSRHTAAILARIGAPELIARDEGEYVAMAVRLGRDAGARAAAAAGVRAGRHRAFGDRSCIRAMEGVLARAVKRGQARPEALPLDSAKGSPLESFP